MKQVKAGDTTVNYRNDEHDAAQEATQRANRSPVGYPEHKKIRSRTNGRLYEISFGPQHGSLVPKNPFASKAQRGYMHAHPEVLGKKGLAEWDKASKGKKLPYHVKKKS